MNCLVLVMSMHGLPCKVAQVVCECYMRIISMWLSEKSIYMLSDMFMYCTWTVSGYQCMMGKSGLACIRC